MLYCGDCLDILKTLPSESVDSMVTDPPAGIGFMGKEWDEDKGGAKQWITWMTSVMSETLRILKPGAHGLVWALPRTSHWTASALEQAGFEIRDVITHLFGSGFPKSLDISKAIDKAAGAERPVIGVKTYMDGDKLRVGSLGHNQAYKGTSFQESKTLKTDELTGPATPEAKHWQGWGTGLKPASEHWILIRKPIEEKTVAANVLKYGTGGINIEKSRVRPNGEAPLQNNLGISIPPNAYAGILKSLPDSFDEITSLSLSQTSDFLERTFSVLDSYSKDDKGLLRSLVQSFRNQSTELSDVLCDYGPSVLRVMQRGQSLLKAEDSQSDYPILFHLGDALIRSLKAFDLDAFPLLSDVRKCISLLREVPGNIHLNDSNLRLVSVWVFAWCLYKSIRLDIQPTGRFPANLVLSHNPDCVEVGTKKVGSGNAPKQSDKRANSGNSIFLDGVHTPENSYGTETVSAWECTQECPVAELDRQSGVLKTHGGGYGEHEGKGMFSGGRVNSFNQPTDTGGASRFFYCAKPSKREKNLVGDNNHPTVKSTKLMKYLITLITPPNGIVLDPFAGSGTTGVGALERGFKFIGIEKDVDYIRIAEKRIAKANEQLKMNTLL